MGKFHSKINSILKSELHTLYTLDIKIADKREIKLKIKRKKELQIVFNC
jgi:hypothetical protein